MQRARTGESVTGVTAYVPLELKKKLNRYCVENDTKISAVIEQLIRQLVGES